MKIKSLIEQPKIAARCAELGTEISSFYRGRQLTVVALLNGGMIFASDLVRHIDLPLELDALAAASYAGDASTGEVIFRGGLKRPIRGRDVLVVDDVLDSGLSMHRTMELLKALEPASIRSCVLLEKERTHSGCTNCDWVGFKIPDVYVVGCGLDSNELYRNLPFVGVVEP
ncbi:MAG: hypoxanthine phosphoribosyltransferase [Victivallaceae bacterium]|nr:hypoxanthine phosphoribosyltransferase [Victivallaceae bacterium]